MEIYESWYKAHLQYLLEDFEREGRERGLWLWFEGSRLGLGAFVGEEDSLLRGSGWIGVLGSGIDGLLGCLPALMRMGRGVVEGNADMVVIVAAKARQGSLALARGCHFANQYHQNDLTPFHNSVSCKFGVYWALFCP